MKTIGQLCWCLHDLLDHGPEGCLRCRDRSRVLSVPFRHPFRARYAPVLAA